MLENWKTMEHESHSYTTIIGVLDTVTKGLVPGFGNKRMSGDHPNYSNVAIVQNSEKSPGELWLAVT